MPTSPSENQSDEINPGGVYNVPEADALAVQSGVLSDYFLKVVVEKRADAAAVSKDFLTLNDKVGETVSSYSANDLANLTTVESLSARTQREPLRFPEFEGQPRRKTEFIPIELLRGYVTRQEGTQFVASLQSSSDQKFEYEFDEQHILPNQRNRLAVGVGITVAAGDQYERGTKRNIAKVFLNYSALRERSRVEIVEKIISKWDF